MDQENQMRSGLEIAIIGMTARFPGADNTEEFFENLKNGIESIEILTDKELEELKVSQELINDPNYVKVRASMRKPEYFDSEFFGYTPEEAKIMDPQMRLLHECAWDSLENAGYNPEQYNGTIGLFVGGTPNPLWESHTILAGEQGIWNDFNSGKSLDAFSKTLLHDKDLMSTRIAYKLNLKGPVITVFTSCSTSLVSVHLAAQSILGGECDVAIAGGVSVYFPKRKGYLYQDGMIVSPDGHCRSFSEEAGGAVFGDGIGLVVLKRLENAIEDGDTIHAIIKGSAINNDGNDKIGYTAPGIEGQSLVIQLAQQMAEVEPESIGYIEGHGSATKLGDSIEIEAMKNAFKNIDKRNRIAIGSVKTNIGHLNSASGIAGLIKTVLSLKHKMLFPSLHSGESNPDLENSPFYINDKLKGFERGAYPLRAGVSSFGVGGTNSHIILEEPPEEVFENSESNMPQLLVLSAKTESALQTQTRKLLDFIRGNPDENLSDIAYTLKVGRKPFQYRKMLICSDLKQAINVLEGDVSGENHINVVKAYDRSINIVFMFSGQGAQYINMGIELYRYNSFFRQLIDKCFDILKLQSGRDLKEILYPGDNILYTVNKLDETEFLQPVLFIFEYALARLLISWGIKPNMLIGYSLGEITAACIAKVFTLEDALKLVTLRGKLINKTCKGMMLSVPLSKEEIMPFMDSELSLAIDNGLSCVISGKTEKIEALSREMANRRIICMPLKSTHAAHSHLLDCILDEYREGLKGIVFSPPVYPLISNVTGRLVENNEVSEPAYWVRQIRETVNFSDGIKEILKEQNCVFMEIGPGRDLALLVHSIITNGKKEFNGVTVTDLIKTENSEISDIFFVLNRIGRLWLRGININWHNFYKDEKRRRIPLPTYPFESQPYWPDNEYVQVSNSEMTDNTDIYKEPSLKDWFYVPSWRNVPLIENDGSNHNEPVVLLFHTSKYSLELRISEVLHEKNCKVIEITLGEVFKKIDPCSYMLNAFDSDNYECLFRELKDDKLNPDTIIHMWSLESNTTHEEDLKKRFDSAQRTGLYSLLNIVKGADKYNRGNKTNIYIITSNLHEITGQECIEPENATLLSTAKVISQEYLNIGCTCIDLEFGSLNNKSTDFIAKQLVNEINAPIGERVIAYRGKRRWVQYFEQLDLKEYSGINKYLKAKGVYLISGGLGDLGFNLAKYLITSYNAKVAIIGKTLIPERDEWDKYIVESNDELAGKLKKLKVLEDLGGTILYYSQDISDYDKVLEIVKDIEKKTGEINGVIHTAGVVGKNAKAAKEMDEEDFETQFRSKVYGLIVIDKIFRNKNLDLCLLTSSLSSILGGLGDTAYAAANIYMDYFAQMNRSVGNLNWISVNWETWLFEKEEKSSATNLGINRIAYAMNLEEGIASFEQLMSLQCANQIIISSGSIQKRSSKWLHLDTIPEDIDNSVQKIVKSRPDLLSDYVEPRNQKERLLAQSWQDFFGIDKIGIRDDFFELGGDSLKAISMIAKTRKETGTQISIGEFFHKPTIEAMAKLIEDTGHGYETVIKAAPVKHYYKTSSAQKRIYILNQLNLNSTAYNEPIIAVLEGTLDKKKLEGVFKKIILKNETLRTGFVFREGELYQKVFEDSDIGISYFNSLEENVEKIISEFIQPFDLSKPPLLRIGLIEINSNKHILILDIHHIITDGISEGILINQIMDLYAGREIKDLQVRYKDYCEWQSQLEGNEELLNQEKYWLETFQKEAPILNLPVDFQRPYLKKYEGDVHSFTISGQEIDGMAELCRNENATLYMFFMSAFIILMNKLTGSTDIVVGTAVSGRKYDELKDIIGMFVNTLPVRNLPEKEKRYTDFLKEVRENIINTFNNQDYQFEDLIDKLAITRDKSRNPLFDIMFVWQNYSISETSIPGLVFKPYTFKKPVSKFDLSLIGFEKDNGDITFNIEYSTNLFKADTIKRFSDCFRIIIKTILQTPDIHLKNIDILSDKERQKVLEKFNDTYTEHDFSKSLSFYLERNALAKGDNAAILCDDYQMSYKEFNEKVNQLANLLIQKGVRANDVVGIKIKRSIDMLIAIWGIIKAGGAYLPIDPKSPEDRKAFMLKDCSAKIVITNTENIIGSGYDGEIININNPELNELSTENPYIEVKPEDAAYVIYTSGSTGLPKGVVIRHVSLLNRLLWMADICNITELDTILQKTTYTFDVSVWEIVLPFVLGAKIYLAKPGGEKEPDYLLNLINNKGITVTHFVPSMLSAFLSVVPEGMVISKLRKCICSGEALTPNHKDLFYRKFNEETELINLYGPTEAAIDVTYCKISKESIKIPIGKPVPNTKIYILDEDKKPVPVGVNGEIYISGNQVGKGYINNPELTARCFINDPFNSGLRMYKTGDIGRWLEDGNIEYIGRNDDQIKIRGFRIELGEIENRLISHPNINEAVVMVNRNNENAGLNAYVKYNELVKSKELKSFLLKNLPDYMIPAKFYSVDEFPLTSSGKIDKKVLHKYGQELEGKTSCIAPESEMEMRIMQIWEDMLCVKNISTDANFFDVGGNSLSLIQLGVKIKEELNIEIPVEVLFQYTTVQSLAGHLADEKPVNTNPVEDNELFNSIEKGKKRMRDKKNKLKDEFENNSDC
ncbi:hybrid non-ribosomal peptide synthetase/type I polyketide synthase [Ruminiclostridium papyrosolvens]|uniref:Beta-ketoacyl synthase n=1 Tax=Ruminiclostridium papyrosolvens C7 TaxID=1330534 RepID=U4R4Y5_9FIRM|nr:hybrid non-ribosomal peptide synthetase/type I polyketide synthase [Ruminiclostridium papyrosolvens]EPR13608.1 beta-ketoacyl synthase [Ruminiclostridium papyrosolvens C7]